MGFIYYIMGKSSSGKDTLYKKIKENMPDLKEMVLYTTRPIRRGEVDGQDYHFVTDGCCNELLDEGRVIELRTYHTVHGIWKYFTVDDGSVDLENQSYLTIGTLESFNNMRKYFGNEKVVPIYIEVEDGMRLERALEREKKQMEPKYAELCRRFLADHEDFMPHKLEESGISTSFANVEFETCLQEILLFIKDKV